MKSECCAWLKLAQWLETGRLLVGAGVGGDDGGDFTSDAICLVQCIMMEGSICVTRDGCGVVRDRAS